jgi:hypothetical protein
MSAAAVLERPTMTRVGLPGRAESVVHTAGMTVRTVLKDLGATLAPGSVPVVGGRPATLDTVIPENAAVTVAPRPQNG